MNVGDLVILKKSAYAPFYSRPLTNGLGIIIEKDLNSVFGATFYVFTLDGILRFADYELELLNGSG
jgi:hypothetical protein